MLIAGTYVIQIQKIYLVVCKVCLLVCLAGELDEGLKKFQDLVKEDPRDMWPYLNLVCFLTLFTCH
jgi:hypothetical protein